MANRPLFNRIRDFFDRSSAIAASPEEAALAIAAIPANGNGKHLKQSGVTLSGFSFVPNGDGTANIVHLENRGQIDTLTAYAVSAYAYVAMRYRAEKLGEPALMVVREDQDDSSEEWLPEHPLAPLLEEPSLDYDMGELLYRTSIYLDMGGACLWVKDSNGRGLPGRLTPYRQGEFTVEPTPGRLRGKFIVETAKGTKTLTSEQVVHFVEPHPLDWTRGTARLDVALRWLNLSESVRQSVKDLLEKSVWPSVIVQTDPTWNPDKDELERFKQELALYGKTKGAPLVLLGGGGATVVAAQIKDLLPEGLLNRVESIVASVFGIPAIVLQYQVGMENAPWSQMEEARRMATEDTLDPRWRSVERVLTRQLLRPMEEDPTLFVRFDRSTIKGLQADRLEQASLAQMMGRDTSLNERRQLVGMDPIDDPAADEIPALQPPAPNPFAPPAPGAEDEEEDEDEDEPPDDEAGLPEEDRKALAAVRHEIRRQRTKLSTGTKATRRGRLVGPLPVSDAERESFFFSWRVMAERQLASDAAAVTSLAERILGEPKEAKAATEAAGGKAADDRNRQRFLIAVAAYYRNTAEPRWKRAAEPLAITSAQRQASAIVAELGIRFDLVQPEVVRFAIEEVGFLVKNISATTIEGIQLTVAAGLDAGESTTAIARALRDSGGFGGARAKLIARTEIGRSQNGAALEAIKEYGVRTGRIYEKIWDTAGDDRVRDEHAAMEGEVAPVDQPFSNGLMYPSEPNCRCRSRFREVTVT
jgi:SPP1 gp7 family putative phage head morphogenesis protein